MYVSIRHYTTNDSPNAVCVHLGPHMDLYFSYETIVAFWTAATGLVACENVWTRTTGKHLNAIAPEHNDRVPLAVYNKMLAEALGRLDTCLKHMDKLELMRRLEEGGGNDEEQ